MNLRRVLILADESADWIVAGLRQLDRLALSIDEFAVDNNETAPVLVAILWRSDLDESQRWVPVHPRLTKVAFTTDLDAQPYDLVLSTRLFLHRKAVGSLFSEGRASARPIFLADRVPDFSDVQKHVPPREGAWDYIANGEQIDDIEKQFLRGSGKSQDGFVSRHLNRPISRAITRLLLRLPATPNGWTWLIFPIPVVAAFVLAQGNYWSFVWGLILFQVFSVLDGCDGEIARAKFMESERGRRRFGWLFLAEGITAAGLIALNEWHLARRNPAPAVPAKDASLGGALYPRHRELVERSGLLVFGEKFASVLIQTTKRDVAVLFFVLLAVLGIPALILHLLFLVTAFTLAFALKR